MKTEPRNRIEGLSETISRLDELSDYVRDAMEHISEYTGEIRELLVKSEEKEK